MARASLWSGLCAGACISGALAPAPAGAEEASRLERAFFGGEGARSNDLTRAPQWSALLARNEKHARTEARLRKLTASIAPPQRAPTFEEIARINAALNRALYRSDQANWRRADYWETPAELAARGGDCEDFAAAKYFALRDRGVAAEDLRLALVIDEAAGQSHAILLVRGEAGVLVLDNRSDEIVLASARDAFRPLVAFNERAWWLAGETARAPRAALAQAGAAAQGGT